MKGIAWEPGGQHDSNQRKIVEKWLKELYGLTTKETWYFYYDYDLVDLVMSDEIFTMYTLKFGI